MLPGFVEDFTPAGVSALMFHKTVMIKDTDLLVPSFPQPDSCTLIIDSLHFPELLLRACQFWSGGVIQQ